MSQTKISDRQSFNAQWETVEGYLKDERDLSDVVQHLASVALEAETLGGVAATVGKLARIGNRLDRLDIEGASSTIIRGLVGGLVDALVVKDTRLLMEVRSEEHQRTDDMIVEEIAFASQELGVYEVPRWMQVEIWGRYRPLPHHMRQWVTEKRSEFDQAS